MPKNGVKVAKFADTTTAFVVLLRGRVEKVASFPWICGIMYQLNKRKYWIFCISKIGCAATLISTKRILSRYFRQFPANCLKLNFYCVNLLALFDYSSIFRIFAV